jgi:hypothetical protein
MHAKVLKAAACRATAGVSAMFVMVALSIAGAQAAQARPNKLDVPCSTDALSAGISAAGSGETLRLAADCVYLLTAPLPQINQALTIDGNDATLERSPAPGTQAFSLLTVGSGASLTVNYLNFRNGGAGEGGAVGDTPAGGAIDNQGDALTVTGGLFSGNTAATGGAIENLAGGLTVTGAFFRHNSAAYGGAIENDGTAQVSQTFFTANTATEWGGAVLSSFTATLSNCFFVRNSAYLGGGLFVTATATVKDGYFRRNQAQYNGGALFNDGGVTLTGTHVSYNSAAQDGGGLYADEFGQSTISGAVFRSNQAVNGGALYNEDFAALSAVHVTGNGASQLGGGIYTNWVLTADGSLIEENSAVTGGGGIYNGDDFGPPGVVDLSSTTLRDNEPDNCENCAPASLPAPRARGRLLPLVLPGAPAPARIKRLALRVTRGHAVLGAVTSR